MNGPPTRANKIYTAAGPVLEGPYAELKLGEVTIQIWTRRGHKDKIDTKRHGIRAREAAERRQAHHPNPALVELDWENDGMPGGPFVFAHINDGRYPKQ